MINRFKNKIFIFFVLSLVFFHLPTQSIAQINPFSEFSSSFQISTLFAPAGQTFTVTQTLKNDSTQPINNVAMRFTIEWGLGQNKSLLTNQSTSCTGALAGATFTSTTVNDKTQFDSTSNTFDPGETTTCTATFLINSIAPVGEQFMVSTEAMTTASGLFNQGLGSEVVTVDSPDGGLCSNISPLPSVTGLPPACNTSCATYSDCQNGYSCEQNRCIPSACTITGFTCDPSTCLALCPSVTISDDTPTKGQFINFTCTTVPGAVRYKFQIIPPSGNIDYLESNSPTSSLYELKEQGHYNTQCQMCTGATEDTCLAPQQM